MKIKLLHIILALGAVVLVGCGGGGGPSDASNTVSSSGLSSEYDGIEEKAVLTEDNSIKFIRSVHYIENLGIEDLSTGTGASRADNHIDPDTGLGYFTFYYEDYLYRPDQLINGQIRTDVLNIEQSPNSVTMKLQVNFDIKISTSDNNITFKVIQEGVVRALPEDMENIELVSMVANKFYIYDQKYNETIELIVKSENKAELYLATEGYAEIENKDREYSLIGDKGTSLELLFKDEEEIYQTVYLDPVHLDGTQEASQELIYAPKQGQGVLEIILNNNQKPDIYFIYEKLFRSEPPKFAEMSGVSSLLEYSYDSWGTYYRLLNGGTENTTVTFEWFVNDVKVDVSFDRELPSSQYNDGDNIKVVATAVHGDVTIRREQSLEDQYYYSLSGIHSGNNYEYPEDTFDLEYRTDNLEFDINLLQHEYFSDVDIGNSRFSWYTASMGFDASQLLVIDGEIMEDVPYDYFLKEGTEYDKTPRITAKQYVPLYEPLYLKVYTGHEVRVVRFNVVLERGSSGIGSGVQGDIIDTIEEANITQDRYIATNQVEHIDLDGNGLDDIIYTSATDDGSFLNISYQNEKKVFTLEKIQNYGGLHLGDYNGDGKQEAFMFGSDENSSSLVNLEKGNIRVVKNIDISNHHNILDLQATSDMNNDGKDDLIIRNNQEDKLYIYENIDDLGQKRLVGASECRSIQAVRDINKDGLNDIICTPQENSGYDTNIGEFTSELTINYFIQNDDETFELKMIDYDLGNNAGINVFGSVMLDESHIAVSVRDTNGYALFTYDLNSINSNNSEPKSKTGTNTYSIDAFFQPTDISNDGMVDIISYQSYGQGRLNIFYQKEDLAFDSDYNVDLNSSYRLIESRFLRNAFLDDIDNDGSLEIVTVNGENNFSYINLK